ncbi:MAG: S-methyl-5'-thioadenosine phosphorylase [Myxococcales bacterium]
MARPILGVIGGSGLYDLPGLTGVRRQRLATPFGEPSDEYLLGKLGEQEMVFLPRHGKGHRLSPTEVNSRANVHGMKQLGVTRLISVSAVGSMKEEISPGELVLVDQFIDRTVARPRTFFGGGAVAHVAFSDPVCPQLHAHLRAAVLATGANAHEQGTYVCIEGPQFSTRAESLLYRSWGVDVIGMTAMPEARLAREAQICYATLALATDYDCWYEAHAAVTVQQVIETMRRNVSAARDVLRAAAQSGAALAERPCGCGRALEHAVITAREAIPAEARERLKLLLGS